MGAAYISVDVTILTRLRPGCLGPRVFAIIREIAAAVLLALPLAYARCSLKESRWSIMTPKNFRLGRDVIVASPIFRLHFLPATYQDCFSLVRCQGESLRVEPCARSFPRFIADSFRIWEFLCRNYYGHVFRETNESCPYGHRDPKDPIVHGIP